MNRRRALDAFAGVGLTAIALAGCGQKGSLYYPTPEQLEEIERKKRSLEEKKRREEEEERKEEEQEQEKQQEEEGKDKDKKTSSIDPARRQRTAIT